MADLGHSLAIVGRIPPNHVWDYIEKMKLNVVRFKFGRMIHLRN